MTIYNHIKISESLMKSVIFFMLIHNFLFILKTTVHVQVIFIQLSTFYYYWNGNISKQIVWFHNIGIVKSEAVISGSYILLNKWTKESIFFNILFTDDSRIIY